MSSPRGYLVAILLTALGVWAGYFMLETALADGLCENDCEDTSYYEARSLGFLVVAVVAFLCALVSGVLAWKKERREAEPEYRPTRAYGFALCAFIPFWGLMLGSAILVFTRP